MAKGPPYNRIKRMNQEISARDHWQNIKGEEVISAKIDTNQYSCKNCNFKARYKFLRCPECNALQE